MSLNVSVRGSDYGFVMKAWTRQEKGSGEKDWKNQLGHMLSTFGAHRRALRSLRHDLDLLSLSWKTDEMKFLRDVAVYIGRENRCRRQACDGHIASAVAPNALCDQEGP